MLSGSHVFLTGSLSAEGKSLAGSSQPRSELCRWGGSAPRLQLLGFLRFLLGFLWFPSRGSTARAVRQAEPPARLQRFPASVLLLLGNDGCSDEGTRLLWPEQPPGRGEGAELRRAHALARMCACARAACPRPGHSTRGFVPLSQEGAAEGLGTRTARAQSAEASVCSFTRAKVLLSHRAALAPVLDPERRVSGPISPGEAQLGRGSIFFKCLCAASEILSHRQANHSICALRSLKIHGILPALGVAGAVHPGRAQRCQPCAPAGKAGERWGPWHVCGW